VTDLHGEQVGEITPLMHANLRDGSRPKELPKKPE
jgi:hypothetical protein